MLALALADVRALDRTEISVIGSDWAAGRCDPAALTEIEREAQRAFAPERLVAAMRDRLARASEADVAAVMGFLASPLGRRVAAVDRSMIAPERLASYPEFASQAMLEAMRGPRWEVLARLESAFGVTRDALAAGTARGLAVAESASAIACASPGASATTGPRLRRRIAPLEPSLRGRMVAELGLRFEDLSTTDLQRLGAFAEGPGAWLFSVVGIGLEEGLGQARAELGERLAPEIARRCAGAAPAVGP